MLLFWCTFLVKITRVFCVVLLRSRLIVFICRFVEVTRMFSVILVGIRMMLVPVFVCRLVKISRVIIIVMITVRFFSVTVIMFVMIAMHSLSDMIMVFVMTVMITTVSMMRMTIVIRVVINHYHMMIYWSVVLISRNTEIIPSWELESIKTYTRTQVTHDPVSVFVIFVSTIRVVRIYIYIHVRQYIDIDPR